jgi:integrase
MSRTKKKAQWSRMIDVHGISIRLYERPKGTTVYMSFPWDGKKVQRSTKRRDRREAAEYARRFVHGLVEDRFLGRTGPVTLGEVFRLYLAERAPLLSDDWRSLAETRRRIFENAWGVSINVEDISQTHIDRYIKRRKDGSLAPEHSHNRKTVRSGTIDNDLRWLSSVFNWGRKFKVDGKRFLSTNPLHEVEWPKEKNLLRPVASHSRFTDTMGVVERVDPAGRLRCMLALARYSGRRESAICQLRASDILRDPAALRRALADLGMDESQADHWQHGAIRWRAAADKQGFETLAPLSERARHELNRYLIENPRVGDAWLFPSPSDDSKPFRRDVAARWLIKAEVLAELPKLRGGVWHPYRRLWATERKHLPDLDVAAAGGWRDTRALKLSYQQADPATMQSVVEAGS